MIEIRWKVDGVLFLGRHLGYTLLNIFAQARTTQHCGICKELLQSLHRFLVCAKSLSIFSIEFDFRRLNCSETDHRPVSDTVDVTKACSAQQPLNPNPAISWPVRRHFKATKFKLVTKIPYRTLVNSNLSCLWWRLFGYLIRRSGVWSSSIRDCVFWHNEPRKHMTRRYSVFHDDKPERLCYSPKPRAWLSKYRNIVLDVFRWT